MVQNHQITLLPDYYQPDIQHIEGKHGKCVTDDMAGGVRIMVGF